MERKEIIRGLKGIKEVSGNRLFPIDLKILDSAISDLQEYEKIESRLDVRKIRDIIVETRKANAGMFHTEEFEAPAILNFLKGE